MSRERASENSEEIGQRKEMKKVGPWSVGENTEVLNPLQWQKKAIFVNFLPPNINPPTLTKMFSPHRHISEIIIPPKLKPFHKYRFAFIKFFHSQDAQLAVKYNDGRRLGYIKVKVQMEKKELTEPIHIPLLNMQTHHHKPNNPIKHQKPPLRDNRTYKEAFSKITNNQTTQPLNPPLKTTHSTNPNMPHHDNNHHSSSPSPHIPTPSFLGHQPDPQIVPIVQNMSTTRLMSSRVLGKDVEATRTNLVIEKLDDDLFGVIECSPSNDNDEVFARSVVVVAASSLSSNNILDHILVEGVNCLSIKPMGGILHLITFDSKESKHAIISSN